ncbi:hypothetical protein QZH41_018181 [Actinostola sp. cb2023]|nr:hypothetical protein QZH41_018181 [Actinostola sp. cb2023]
MNLFEESQNTTLSHQASSPKESPIAARPSIELRLQLVQLEKEKLALEFEVLKLRGPTDKTATGSQEKDPKSSRKKRTIDWPHDFAPVDEGIIKELDIHEKVLPHEINYNKYPHLADISIPEVEHKAVSLIIGEDVKNAHIVQEVIAPDKEDECSLYAGWHDSHQKTTEEPIILYLLDIPPMMAALNGVVMELQDCALPLLQGIVATADAKEAFTNIDVAILVGAMPRREGMERKDLLEANAKIFVQQGKVLMRWQRKLSR